MQTNISLCFILCKDKQIEPLQAWLMSHAVPVPAEQSLGQTFAWSVFLGNGLMAIAAGQIGDFLVEGLGLGRVAPFDGALVAMVIGGVIMMATWGENYGGHGTKDMKQQMSAAFNAIMDSKYTVLPFDFGRMHCC